MPACGGFAEESLWAAIRSRLRREPSRRRGFSPTRLFGVEHKWLSEGGLIA
jgi:hypothetical protein